MRPISGPTFYPPQKPVSPAGSPRFGQKPTSPAADMLPIDALQQAMFIVDYVMAPLRKKSPVGKYHYQQGLRDEGIHMGLKKLVPLLESHIKQFDDIMTTVAREIDPDKKPREILKMLDKEVPSLAEFVDVYSRCITEARQFLRDNELIDLPASNVTTILTPKKERKNYPYASYDPTDRQMNITPYVSRWPRARKKELKQHCRSVIPMVTTHECYPGHHTQLQAAGSASSFERSFSEFMQEGWGMYAEFLMMEAGFIHKPEEKLQVLDHLRGLADAALDDIKLHTRQTSARELRKEYRHNSTRKKARLAVKSHLEEPLHASAYYLGFLQVLGLREAVFQTNPGMTLKEFHNRIINGYSSPWHQKARQAFKIKKLPPLPEMLPIAIRNAAQKQ